MNISIDIESGKTMKLLTAGKYCDKDILVTVNGYTEEELQSKYEEGRNEALNELFSTYAEVSYKNTALTTIDSNAFSKSRFAHIELPWVREITVGSAFANTSKLKSVTLPILTGKTGGYAFANCANLAVVDLGSCKTIGTAAFSGCSRLTTLVLRYGDSNTPSLVNTNAFTGVGSGRTVTVYVNKAIIDKIKSATNWSVLYAKNQVKFVALEGSAYA